MTALTEEPVVFGSGVEALRNALASRFSASLSAELVALGVDLERPQAGRNFKQATNYIETETREVAPTELHLRIFTNARFLGKTSERTNLVTDYRRGVLLEVLQFVRVEGQVEIIEADPARHDATFRIHWR